MENETLNNIAAEVAKKYYEQLKAVDARATGSLLNFQYEVQMGERSCAIIFKMPLSDKGFPYWRVIEEGRRAGKWPNIEAIRKWVIIKPIIPRADSRGKVPSTNQLTYLIGRSIFLKGIQPRHALVKGLMNAKPELSKFEDALKYVIFEKYNNVMQSIVRVTYNKKEL